jgi:hypothetical protein
VTQNNKADRLVAERAQRQRHEAKLEHRRKVYRDSLDQIVEEERIALMKKHGLPVPTPSKSDLSRNSSASVSPSASQKFGYKDLF